MPLDKDTKNKLMDGAMVAAKATGLLTYGVLAAGLAGAAGGGRVSGGILPRPINIWKNQRRTRAFRDALEKAGVPMDFGVRMTFKDKQPKVSSLAWAAINIGADKWEMAYHLVKSGSVNYGSTRCEIVR